MRTFIAIELPQFVSTALEQVQKSLRANKLNIRWVTPQHIHLTLKFLGDISAETVEPISRVLVETARNCDSIALAASGIGVFPGIKNPRVIWVGVSGKTPRLKALQQSLEEGLTALGHVREKRAFKAHLTIGRIRGAVDPIRLNSALNSVRDFKTEPFWADRICLFQSVLKPSGPVYTKIASAALASSL